MLSIKDFQVGDKVYLKPIGNSARRIMNKDIIDYIIEAEISKIGRKYIYLKNRERLKFNLQNGRWVNKNDSVPSYELYKSKTKIINEVKRYNLSRRLRSFLSWPNNYKKLSLDQLEKIEDIIKEQMD